MSLRAKLTFLGSCGFTFSIISYVMISHKMERDNVKVGVTLDLERQRVKQEKLEYMKQQENLTKAYREAERKDKLPITSW